LFLSFLWVHSFFLNSRILLFPFLSFFLLLSLSSSSSPPHLLSSSPPLLLSPSPPLLIIENGEKEERKAGAFLS